MFFVSIISKSEALEKFKSRVSNFFIQKQIGKLLKQSNFYKESGFTCIELTKFVFLLVFGRKNLYQTLQSEDADKPGKDTVYRFLNSCRFNWRKFLLLLSSGIIQEQLTPLTSENSIKVLILDDSLFRRGRSKAVELLARVHDHVSMKYVRGFRMLTLGWSDGNSFIPLCFSLLSSEKAENRLCKINNSIDKRTVGYRRRKESIKKSTEVIFDLLQQAKNAGVQASYLLFDSWFAFPKTIIKVLDQGLDVICMVKALPRVFYLYQGQKMNLQKLYSTLRKKRGKAKILTSAIVTIGTDEQGREVQAKIVFVRDRNRSKKWLALMSTDIELADEEIVRIYGKRWDIEVFFKMTKSYLSLAKEFQGRSYDMMFAHTTIVFARYIMLAIESRENRDPRTLGNLFYVCCDEMEDIKFASAILLLLDLLKRALQEVLLLTEEQFQKIFEYFITSLPTYIKGLLGVQVCES
ncbi:MAG: IS4 family transposase [Bacillota bacterium]